jgi:hypothetical protein
LRIHLGEPFAKASAGKDGAAVDVEDFAGDKAGVKSAEEEDGAGDLVDVNPSSSIPFDG